MPKDLLIEIGVEEIPASYVLPALKQFEEALAAELESARLSHGDIETMATPRRFAAIVRSIADAQETVSRTVTGPPARIAFDDDGKPTKAATGFARSQGVDVDALEVVDDYVRVDVVDQGGASSEVLPGLLARAIEAMTFPKTMRWGPDVRFARPIRWLVAMLGGEVLEFEYAGCAAGAETRGLRFHAPGPHALSGADEYRDVLARAHVVVDHQERRAFIAAEAARLAADECGGRVVTDEGLLDEVTFLTERPTVFAGRFDERFLELPRHVIIAAMKGHQRYFAVEREDGTLLPRFLCVANALPGAIEGIRQGNERVLVSRLDDAVFYWREDTRTPLASKVDRLKDVVWLEGLGSLYEKTERIESLAGLIAERLDVRDRELVLRAARLSKADLVTEMVKDGKEFTELQGSMGREYALQSGEPEAVADAIVEHYMPRFAGDALPEGPPGTILGLADRIDSIVGCFSAGLVPTGSQDPYALRRQAIGFIRIVGEKELELSIVEIVERAAELFGVEGDERRELVSAVVDFLRQRARVVLMESGHDYDLVDAVLGASFDDFVGVRPRLEALSHFREAEDFAPLVIGARRVTNILKGREDAQHDPAALTEPASVALEEARVAASNAVDRALAEGDHDAAVRELLRLRKPIDAFFDDVMVMVDDEKLRRARLGLLSEVRKLFLRMADFAQVVLEGEKEEGN
ncbi:MAG: glycine--tRNA ligase subunit beta [Candidatus Eisenbacteria bacterium]|nr:glycine--tRNA ligase subunit beta [Candidatus Eisenbacteria bacterium]